MGDAFQPLTSLGLSNAEYEGIWRACDPFDTKFISMVEHVAAYVNSVSAFTGNVIVVTSPPGVKGCEGVSAPNGRPAAAEAVEADITKPPYWFHHNPSSVVNEGTAEEVRFGKLAYVETAWADAFGRHARRLKFSLLNVTHMSELRADVRVPDGSCQHFCFPGLPHHWAEMMVRLLEQLTFGATDGLYR